MSGKRIPLRRPGLARRSKIAFGVAGLTAVGAFVVPGLAASGAVVSGNVVRDPQFRHVSTNWTVTSGARMRVTRGHGNHRVLAITNTTKHSRTIALNDRRNTISNTRAGESYTASAWVRVSKPGETAAVREGEWQGRRLEARTKSASVWLRTRGWRHVSITYRAVKAHSSIDFNILVWKLAPHATLYVDSPRLVATLPPAPKPTPKPKPTPPKSTTPAPPKSTPPAPPTTTPAPPPSSPGGGDAKLVFDDEFNGTSVDTSKWNVRNNSYASNEESIDTSRPQNVAVGNGVLTIQAQRESYTAYSTTRDYTSGYLDSIGKFSQQYGRWEMRAKLPDAKGMWPAFWLRGNSKPGEIDILEAIGGLPKMTVQTVFPSTNDGSVKKSHQFDVTSGGGITGWHVYGVTWTPTSISWDVDGSTVFTVTSSDAAWVSSAFQDAMNIRLNLQVGGSMPKYFQQNVDASSPLPAQYQIDWVRVYSA